MIIQGYVYQEKLQKALKGTKVAADGCRGPSYLEARGSSGDGLAAKAREWLNTETETLVLGCAGAKRTESCPAHRVLHWWWVRLTLGPTRCGWFYVETVCVYKHTENMKVFVSILYVCIVSVVPKLKLGDKPGFPKSVLIICEDVSEQYKNWCEKEVCFMRRVKWDYAIYLNARRDWKLASFWGMRSICIRFLYLSVLLQVWIGMLV